MPLPRIYIEIPGSIPPYGVFGFPDGLITIEVRKTGKVPWITESQLPVVIAALQEIQTWLDLVREAARTGPAGQLTLFDDDSPTIEVGRVSGG